MLLPIVWFVLSLFAGLCGRKRAFGFWGFFIASVFFSPVLVLTVLVLTSPSRVKESYS